MYLKGRVSCYRGHMWPVLLGFGFLAFCLNGLLPKRDPHARPPVIYDGKPVDTTPANLKDGATAAELDAWATAQGFKKLDTRKVPDDVMSVVRAFEVELFDARKAHDVPAMFGTMAGNPFLAGVVDDHTSSAYMLPP